MVKLVKTITKISFPILLIILVSCAPDIQGWASESSLAAPLPKPKIDAQRFDAQDPPLMIGHYAVNTTLTRMELVASGQLSGPEDFAIADDGTIYTGSKTGVIHKISQDGKVEIFAKTGGHPLGMALDHHGNLIVCEPYSGLLRIDQSGNIEILATEVEGKKFRLVDAVTIASDGMIYFTDASFKFSLHDFILDILENSPNGRLLRYNPKTGGTSVLLSKLYFANGVALSADESYILINETSRYRIRKFWLKGLKQGQSQIFADNLPGTPDGISLSASGSFWVAFYAPRDKNLDFIHRYPKLKNLLGRLPRFLLPKTDPYGFIAEYSSEGQPLRSFQDPKGRGLKNITSVRQFRQDLYLGALNSNAIGILKLDNI